jgi:acetyltransferase-like isoleucine patch superfamily enzyme
MPLPTHLLVGPWRASVPRTAWELAHGRKMVVGSNFRVRGARNIEIDGDHLRLGITPLGFADNRTHGLLNVRGSLKVGSGVVVGTGTRWDIGPDAKVEIGEGCIFSANTLMISTNSITIGKRVGISWDVQIMDDNFHEFSIDGVPSPQTGPVVIGDDAWVAPKCVILRGTRLAEGCAVATGTVVSGVFDEPYCLIAGSPAKVVRRNVKWVM